MARHATFIAATVKPGRRIDLPAPAGLDVGDAVDVVLLVDDGVPHATPGRSFLDILDSLPPGIGIFKSAREVDAYIREERDSWDR